MNLRVGLFGFGRTGSIVAKEIVNDSNLDLKWVCRNSIPTNLRYASHALGFDRAFAPFVTKENLTSHFLRNNPVDLIIDFSSSSGSRLYSLMAENGIKIVSAISNYSLAEIKTLNMVSKETAILHSPNITLGINWLMLASKMLKNIIPNADIEVVEEHFRDKKDVSGTALKLAENLDLDSSKHVNSIRVGGIIGKHEVIFGLPYQTLRLTHESVSRSAFGTGAIFAAKWLSDKSSGLFSMEKALNETFINNLKINNEC